MFTACKNVFLKFKHIDSLTKVLMETGMPSFNTLMRSSHIFFFQNVRTPTVYIIVYTVSQKTGPLLRFEIIQTNCA